MTTKKSPKTNVKKPRTERRKQRKMWKEFGFLLLRYVIYAVHYIKDSVLNLFFSWYWSADQKQCPSLRNGDEFLSQSAVDLAEMIRMGKITSVKLVTAYTARLKDINPMVNAIVDGPFDDAITQAQQIDERIANGQISEDEFAEKPFLGVPFTTKDSTAVKGKLHTLGILSRKSTTVKDDAEIVQLMKEAGAIILATSSIPEVNRWQETRNNIVGQTKNPYDPRRTVGGSSGGEGAVISACGSAFGLGTDIGGSIRMPCFYCGIFGHKPTTGIVNMRGCTLRTGKEVNTMVVAGPMARHAKDMVAIFKILAGPKNVISLKLNDAVDVKRLKYYYIMQNDELRCSSVSSELQTAMSKVVNHFTDIAHERPQKIRLPGIDQSFRMWRYWITQEPFDFSLVLGNGVRINALAELAKKLCGQSDFTFAAVMSLLDSQVLPKENADKIRELTRQCDEELTNILGDDGVLLYHSMPLPAPFHCAPLVNPYNFSYSALFNVLHVPATQVPLGLNADGIPLGIQVVAARNRDRHCLAVAEELERAFGGWVPPFRT